MKRHVLVVVLLLTANIAFASWYDDYNAGIDAVRKGQWRLVIEKMTSAISGNKNENNAARTYGNIFINYHPYYYRGLAYLRTGKYEQAISDFEKTSGPGEIDRGSIEELMQDAKTKQAAANVPTPEPVPVPKPVQPTPVPVPVPAGPSIDPALRQQVTSAIKSADQSLAGARGRNAGSSPQYKQALTALAEANQRVATAKNNDDLQAALASANNAKLFADSAMAAPVPVPRPVPQPGPGGKPMPPLFDQYQPQLRRALESYFDGEFEQAASEFKSLSVKLPTNGWIWAFLGASQYSQYAFEADESYKTEAMKSFRKAKQFRSWGKDGLPQKYFSKRIRRVFESAS